MGPPVPTVYPLVTTNAIVAPAPNPRVTTFLMATVYTRLASVGVVASSSVTANAVVVLSNFLTV